jgi:hypothetical protein
MAVPDTDAPRRSADPAAGDRNRELFIFARSQVAAGRPDTLKREAERRRWRPHRRRFT